MAIETKTFTVEVKAGDEGKFKALIATFNVPDKRGDVVKPGAFKATLERWRATNGRIPVVFDHQASDPLLHVGEVNPHNSMETAIGLTVSGQIYMEEERGAKVFRQLQRGALREWSYGYLVKKARPLPDGGRELIELDVIELGPTVKGVGDTSTLEVRSATAAASALAPAHRLAPFRARLRLAQLRDARWSAAR